jgi:hypothetical protein
VDWWHAGLVFEFAAVIKAGNDSEGLTAAEHQDVVAEPVIDKWTILEDDALSVKLSLFVHSAYIACGRRTGVGALRRTKRSALHVST